MNFTVEFISGRKIFIRIQNLHLHLHGRLLAVRFRRNLGNLPSYLRSGNASTVTIAFLFGPSRAEIVLRDVEFDLQDLSDRPDATTDPADPGAAGELSGKQFAFLQRCDRESYR